MNMHDVLNLSAAELKAKRPECIAAVVAAKEPEIAARLVQAVIDAKVRDVRMGEMGKEITDLEGQLATAQKTHDALDKQRADSVARQMTLERKLAEVTAREQALASRIAGADDALGKAQQAVKDMAGQRDRAVSDAATARQSVMVLTNERDRTAARLTEAEGRLDRLKEELDRAARDTARLRPLADAAPQLAESVKRLEGLLTKPNGFLARIMGA